LAATLVQNSEHRLCDETYRLFFKSRSGSGVSSEYFANQNGIPTKVQYFTGPAVCLCNVVLAGRPAARK
jgi:hypothetical protein